MDNFKKIGLTALAGSLVAVSANAAELTVSGSAVLSYVTEEHSAVASNRGGNGFGMKNNMSFTGTGEVNGMDVTYFNTLSDTAGVSSSRLTLGMGDMGSIYFDQGVGGNGIGALDEDSPTAYEEPTDGMTGGNVSLAGAGSTNTIGYTGSFSGVGLAINIDPVVGDSDTADGAQSGDGTGSAWSAVVTAPTIIDGLSIRAGYGTNKVKDGTTTATESESIAASVRYTVGPITAGVNHTETTGGSAGAVAHFTDGYGVVFSVNENLSLSYTKVENEFANAGSAHVTEDSTGLAIAYTMGGATLVVQQNDQDNGGGSSGKTEERTEINLSFAF